MNEQEQEIDEQQMYDFETMCLIKGADPMMHYQMLVDAGFWQYRWQYQE